MGISLNKVMIEISKAQKDLDILNGCRDRPFHNGDDIIMQHRNAIKRNDEARERDKHDMKLTLAELAS